MRILVLFSLSVLLCACGQTGQLYLPGTATGVHKKDRFIFGNANTPQQLAVINETRAQSSNNGNTAAVAIANLSNSDVTAPVPAQ